MADKEYFDKAQTEWTDHSCAQADEFVPDISRGRWRSFSMKLRPTEGTGFSLSMRLVNSMGIERVVEPTQTAQKSARELFALYAGLERKDWEIIELRFFNQGKDPNDETKIKVSCKIIEHPAKKA